MGLSERLRGAHVDELENEDGEIPTAPSDYAQRQGMICAPHTSVEVTHVLPVLHEKLQTFNWLARCFLVCLKSHKKWHSVFQPVRYTQQKRQEENDAYKALQTKINHQLGFDIGSASDMDTSAHTD